MAETSGELLGGRFRLLGERTSFPFGAWWEAEDDQGARTVVLRMNAEVADPAAKAKAAIDATAKLDATHIVAWVGGGVDAKGHGWLAAPMFGPWSLHEHVSRGEGIPPSEAALLIHQLARAVASAEAAGVTHNTLTSEFVRMVPLPEGGHGVKVYGFGLSDLLPSYKPLRKQDAYLGVPDYMSPELCAGKAAEGSSADIYALGIIMYEAVRGRPPFAPTFASASASTTLKRHIFEKPLPLHVRYASAPFIKPYEAIAFKALAKTANRRQASVSELETELEQLIVDEMRAQVVPVEALSGRGQSTSRRLRTQVIAQIPVEEAKIEVEVAPAVAASSEPAAGVQTSAALKPQEREPAVAAPAAALEAAPAAAEEAASPRRGDATLVFAGLGPAVREMAEAARKADEPDEAEAEEDEGEGEAEEEEPMAAAEVASAAAPATTRPPGRRKKGRKGSAGAMVVSRTAPTVPGAERQAPKIEAGAAIALATSPSSATVVTSRVSETVVADKAAASAGKVEPSGARIRKKDESAPVAAKGKEAPAVKTKDDQEWFDEEEARASRGSRAWILVLLAAAVVVVVVILLMSGGGKNNEEPPPTGAGSFSSEVPTSRYPIAESERRQEPAAGEADKAPGASETVKPVAAEEPASDKGGPSATESLTAPTPAGPPAGETPAPAKAETPTPAAAGTTPEPVKSETPPPAKTEAPPPQPAKAETPPEPPKAPKPAAATKVETPEPAKVEAPKPAATEPTKELKDIEAQPVKMPEPGKVEGSRETKPPPGGVVVPEAAKTEPPATPEDQFKQKAKHYIELGIQAYKSENFKLAVGYFKKAQEADPTNSMAARYLKQASEKVEQ